MAPAVGLPTNDPTPAAMKAVLILAPSVATSFDKLATVGAGRLTNVPVKDQYRTQKARMPDTFVIAMSERLRTAEAQRRTTHAS